MTDVTWGAVILAGGGGNRLGGVDKALLRHEGRTFLERSLEACRAAAEILVVGLPRKGFDGVRFVSESPPGGGPAAGAVAGLAALSTPVGVVMAVDLPVLDADAVQHAAAAAPAVLMAPDGRAAPALSTRLPLGPELLADDWHGRPLRELVEALGARPLTLVDADLRDVDTPEDARAILGSCEQSPPPSPGAPRS